MTWPWLTKSWAATEIKMFRVGLGQDSHRFAEGKSKPLVLGGFVIPGEKGMDTNSDGDVMLHAVFNALSQAIGGRSIGYYADSMCFEEGITDSKEYVKVALRMVEEKGYKISNIGLMVEAKRPMLEPHSDAIKKSLAAILGIDKSRVGLTFTTGDGLTSFGKGEGIQAFAIASLVKNE